ncbi:AAA family ATPase [Thermodesulfatator atlanticus]|uniref:hypothetical protein n=1 Tax=Thermodesulfatator atlanticus TaxID=501497 RepID=UPI0003B44C26|nr:hypothetical protein [Thermodesulfatator atlanticus]
MKLSVKIFPEINTVFYVLSQEELEKNVKKLLKNIFHAKDKELDLSPQDFVGLNTFFANLKKLLGNSSKILPVSFVSSGQKGLVRPGRVYLSQKHAEKIKDVLDKWPFTASLIPWKDFFELRFPETSYVETEFSFRDLLLIGPYSPCPFCGLRWHPPGKCPGIKEKEVFEIIFRCLKQSPQTLFKTLNQYFQEGITKETEAFFSKRLFYLRPGFLHFVFAANPESYAQMPKKFLPSRGGNLYLGLEALYQGNISQAKKRFNSFDLNRDIFAILGLLFCSAYEGNITESLFYVEKAKSLAKTPFLKAYLSFWRGWLHEIENKGLEAEEYYQEALRFDRFFWPAKFHLARTLVKFSPEKAKNLVTALFQENEAIPLILSEGAFFPFAPDLEKQITTIFEDCQKEAITKLAQAENNLRPLIKFLPEEDIKELEERIANLRKEIYEGGFLSLILAEKKALELSLELQGYLFRQAKALRGKYQKLKRSYDKLEYFWRTYPYRREEYSYKQKLDLLREELAKLSHFLQGDVSRSIKPARRQIEKIEEIISALEKEKEEIKQRWQFKKQLNAFLRTFVILETLLFLFFLSIPALSNTLGDGSPPAFFSLESFIFLSMLILFVAIFYALRQKI